MDTHDDNHSDAARVARVLAGERAAFDPLLLRYYASVLRLCQRLLGSPSEAQDVAQDAALHAYAEMAELLGVPVSTVRGRVFQGRQQLRRALEPLAHETLSPDRRALKEHPMAESDRIRLTFDSIYAEAWAHHRTVLLRAKDDERVLALRVGKAEGDVIVQTLHGEHPPRPLTHDLALQLLAPAGVQITQVVIHSLAARTYYAAISVAHGQHSYEVEARPSDALALAIRADAPILIARALFNSAAVPLDDLSILGMRVFKGGEVVNDAAMYSVTMPELAAKQPEPAQPVEWNGQPAFAFPLPLEHERSWLNLPLPRADESVCLVMNTAFWERMQEYMRQVRELREQVELTRQRDEQVSG